MKMIFKFFVIFIMGVYVIGCNSKKNDLVKNNLKGKVKSISEFLYAADVNDGNITKGYRRFNDGLAYGMETTNKTIFFNNKGDITEEYIYNEDDENADVNWLMGQVHKQARGNLILSHLRKEIELKIRQA